jgi:hypothetical protein
MALPLSSVDATSMRLRTFQLKQSAMNIALDYTPATLSYALCSAHNVITICRIAAQSPAVECNEKQSIAVHVGITWQSRNCL